MSANESSCRVNMFRIKSLHQNLGSRLGSGPSLMPTINVARAIVSQWGQAAIAVVLLVGLVLTWIRPGSTRGVGLAAQAFALLGTLLGIFTIAIGVGRS